MNLKVMCMILEIRLQLFMKTIVINKLSRWYWNYPMKMKNGCMEKDRQLIRVHFRPNWMKCWNMDNLLKRDIKSSLLYQNTSLLWIMLLMKPLLFWIHRMKSINTSVMMTDNLEWKLFKKLNNGWFQVNNKFNLKIRKYFQLSIVIK